MPADTAAKRYSAINIKAPWRRLSVAPNVGIPQGERQAVMFMYYGILAAPLVPLTWDPGTGRVTSLVGSRNALAVADGRRRSTVNNSKNSIIVDEP